MVAQIGSDDRREDKGKMRFFFFFLIVVFVLFGGLVGGLLGFWGVGGLFGVGIFLLWLGFFFFFQEGRPLVFFFVVLISFSSPPPFLFFFSLLLVKRTMLSGSGLIPSMGISMLQRVCSLNGENIGKRWEMGDEG